MNDEIIIFDTEYWTDEGVLERSWKGIDDHPPVLIQIGGYKIKLKDELPIIEDWLSYVTPISRDGKNIKLNNYFSDLTGITQKKIDQDGRHPKQAISEFSDFVGPRKMYSYGDDVIDTFLPTCFMNGLVCPFDVSQVNDIRHIFRKSGITEAEISTNRSGSIAQHFGVYMDQHHEHDAKDDALSILEALRFLVKNGRLDINWLND